MIENLYGFLAAVFVVAFVVGYLAARSARYRKPDRDGPVNYNWPVFTVPIARERPAFTVEVNLLPHPSPDKCTALRQSMRELGVSLRWDGITLSDATPMTDKYCKIISDAVNRELKSRITEIQNSGCRESALLELKGHTDSVTSVAFGPDGKKVLTGSWDRTARIWDARTGEQLLALQGHPGTVYCVAFSPDGTRIITGSEDRTARIWDAHKGTMLLELKGHVREVTGVAFSPDGTRVVTGSWDHTARIWDATQGTTLLELKGHVRDVTSVAFSPDGTRVVTGSADRTAMIWDATQGTMLLQLKGHADWVTGVAFSPDGTRVVTGSADRTAMIWDAHKGTMLLQLKGHIDRVRDVAFSPDGTKVLTGGWDQTARIWDVTQGTTPDSMLLSAKLDEHGRFHYFGQADVTVTDHTINQEDTIKRLKFSVNGLRYAAKDN